MKLTTVASIKEICEVNLYLEKAKVGRFQVPHSSRSCGAETLRGTEIRVNPAQQSHAVDPEHRQTPVYEPRAYL
ncbi:MAG: hypothetical protein Roseis2KO_03860 [Roseivirga sp.]